MRFGKLNPAKTAFLILPNGAVQTRAIPLPYFTNRLRSFGEQCYITAHLSLISDDDAIPTCNAGGQDGL